MSVGVGQVKEALAPGRVARRCVGAHAGGDQPGVERIDIGVVENQPAPPRPPPLVRLRNQVEKIVASDGDLFDVALGPA